MIFWAYKKQTHTKPSQGNCEAETTFSQSNTQLNLARINCFDQFKGRKPVRLTPLHRHHSLQRGL